MKLLYKIALVISLVLFCMHNAESIETSFAELKTQLKSKNLMKLNTNIGNEVKAKLTVRDLLVATMGTKKKNRITSKGHKCKQAFNFNGKDYNDCTIDKAPDGQIPLKEWCLIYPSPETTDVWDYCKPDMNYDKIRRKVQEIIKNYTEETRQVTKKTDDTTPKESNLISWYSTVLKGQADLSFKVNQLFAESLANKNSLDHLTNIKKSWEELENKAVFYSQEIEKQNERIKILKEQAKSQKEKSLLSDTPRKKYTEDEIKIETEMHKISIADWIQEKEPSLTKDCNGMLNYEEMAEGTGLSGRYYNNPTFSGSYKSRLDREINLEFTGGSPMKGINSQNFSVMWDGYLKIPFRGNYYITIQTEGGAEVYLSGKKIISHKMYQDEKQTAKRDLILSDTISAKGNPITNNSDRSVSQGIQLAGGDMYIIRVKYYHSIHDFFSEDIRTFIKLSWYSDDIVEEIINTRYLFPSTLYTNFKISGIDPEIGIVSKLEENGLAFKDSKTFIIQDIPKQYIGNPALKISSTYKLDKIEFKINTTINVFIAKIDYYKRPFPDDFENMGEFLSLLELNEPDEKDKLKSNFFANTSVLMRIYKKKFKPGLVKIPLNNKSGLSVKGNPLIIFFSSEPTSDAPIACGGKLLWLSNPNGEDFAECNSSSKFNNSWDCKAGLSERMMDSSSHMWASNNEGIGAYIYIRFKDIKEVHSITYLDRRNPGEQSSKIEFEFSGGESFLWEHRNSSDEENISFPIPYRTYWIKATIKEVYGTINNGFALKVYGTACKTQSDPEGSENKKVIKPLFEGIEQTIYNINCLESISNSKQLANVNRDAGQCILINCNESCVSSNEDVVYGSKNYSKDSSICKAGVHSGILTFEGGKSYLCFGKDEADLKGSKQNGVESKGKSRTDLTISFKVFKDSDYISLNPSTKFDVKESFIGKWQNAYVVKSVNPLINQVLYRIEGSNSNKEEYAFLARINPLVAPCGTKVKGRDCGSTKVETVKKINIRFTSKSKKGKGEFVEDNGEIYGTKVNGIYKPYGWSRDMSSNIKVVDIPDEGFDNFRNIAMSYVEFPPDKKSKYCNSKNVICDSVNYTIKTGEGRFMVKLFVNIRDSNTIADFNVNGITLAKNAPVRIGEMKIFEGVVESIDGLLDINTECSGDCFYSRSRLNMIQIYPHKEEEVQNEEEIIQEGEICSGKVKRGMDCDSGKVDVKFCVFQTENSVGAQKCNGSYSKIKMPKKYDACIEASGLEYCIPKQFDKDQCSYYCPTKCVKDVCVGS